MVLTQLRRLEKLQEQVQLVVDVKRLFKMLLILKDSKFHNKVLK